MAQAGAEVFWLKGSAVVPPAIAKPPGVVGNAETAHRKLGTNNKKDKEYGYYLYFGGDFIKTRLVENRANSLSVSCVCEKE